MKKHLRLPQFITLTNRKKSDIPSEKIYNAWRLQIKTPKQFESNSRDQLSFEQLLYLAWFGLLAPSTHNSVPQRFKLIPEKNVLEIWLDRQFVLPQSDSEGRQACISIGCAQANIDVAARYYGFLPQVTFPSVSKKDIAPGKTGKPRYTHILTIRFSRGKQQTPSAWIWAMLNRKTVRGEYNDAVKLSSSLVTRMKKYVKKSIPSTELHVFVEKNELNLAGKFQEMADREVFENGDFAYELGHWLLPNDDIQSPVGIRGKEIGFPDDFSRRIHKGLLREETLLPDEIAGFATSGKFIMRSSSAVGIITVENDDIKDWVHAGQAAEEIALLLLQNHFAISIHAGIVEVEHIGKMFATSVLHTKRKPTVIFRIGKPKRPVDNQRPHSSRPAIEDIILK